MKFSEISLSVSFTMYSTYNLLVLLKHLISLSILFNIFKRKTLETPFPPPKGTLLTTHCTILLVSTSLENKKGLF